LTEAAVGQQAAAGEVISSALTAETNDLLPVPAGSTLNTLVVLNRRLGWLPSVDNGHAPGRRSLSPHVHELTLEEWARRPLPKRYLDNVMRLTSALQ
jgi:hypothetical protein